MTRCPFHVVTMTAIVVLIAGFALPAAAHYDPVLGRWMERDPAGYVDGMNHFQYGRSMPATESDPYGDYPGLPGHGNAISPDGSVTLVGRHQRFGDTVYNTYKDKWWFRALIGRGARQQSVFRLAAIATQIGTNDDNRFVFTCSHGWIDMGHYFNNALLTGGTQIISGRLLAALLSYGTEQLQWWGGSDSAFSPEDYISNYYGRELGSAMRAGDVNDVLFDFKGYWAKFLQGSGAVRWGTGYKVNGKTVEQFIADDLADMQKNPPARFNFESTAATMEAAMEWYRSRPLMKCLCKDGKPVAEEIIWRANE